MQETRIKRLLSAPKENAIAGEMLGQNFKGYCIRIPIEPELGITAPCKLWCTLVALLTSCNRQRNIQHNENKILCKKERDLLVWTMVYRQKKETYFKLDKADGVPFLSQYFHLLKTWLSAYEEVKDKADDISNQEVNENYEKLQF